MSGATASPWQLPHDELVEAARAKETRSNLLDFALFAMLPLFVAVPGLEVPLPELGAMAILLLGFTRRPDHHTPRPIAADLLVVGFLSVCFTSAYLNHALNIRRLGHLVVFGLLILVLASGRVQRLAAVRGLALGLFLVISSAYVNLVVPIWGEGYEGRLTGLIGDPNSLGFYLTTLGCLAFTGLRPGLPRVLGVLLTGATIVLTLSRTSIVVLIVVTAWLIIRRMHRPTLALPLFAGVVYVVQVGGERLKNWGPFAERAGSDMLRERIEVAEQIMVHQSPWIGNGPGTSVVDLDGRNFFFHSSWMGLRNEFGWLGTAAIVALVCVVAAQLLRLSPEDSHPWYEGALIASMLCAVNLGEVLLELNTAVVLGLALRHALAPHELTLADRGRSSNHTLW